MRPSLILPALVFLLTACTRYQSKYTYSIADFKPELREHLEAIVQNGGICSELESESSRYLSEKVSYADLEKLTLSEHPLLRAAAFSAICFKKVAPDSTLTMDQRAKSQVIDRILLSHLDDMAIITHCMGEWGDQYIYVSDYYLQYAQRKTKIPEAELADEVLRNHNYLFHALRFLEMVPKDSDKYYGAIKQIVNRKSFFSFYSEFRALSILSAYKKQDDVPFIAEKLSRAWRDQDDGAFELIRRNPAPAYFKIIEKYYSILSGMAWDYSKVTFMGTWGEMQENYIPFLAALLNYKNKRSADIATDIIKRQLFPPNGYFTKASNERTMYFLMKENECPAYAGLINKLKAAAEASAIEFTMPQPLEIRQIFTTKNDYW